MTTTEIDVTEPQQLALATRHYEPPAYMTPAGRKAAIDDTLNKVALVMEIMDKAMRDGEHYGTIPGCGEKKALLKGGAEKLGLTFHLKPQFEVSRIDHPNYHREYQVKCILSDGTQGVGTCSTLEGKYRYRSGERKCPKCGKPTIIVGKAEYGGGFLCFAKKGGCGAKFTKDDKAITSQSIERVEHDNPADFWNTCLKMAKKRAHVDSIITATACSDIFTQDVEEAVEAADTASQESAAQRPAASPLSAPAGPVSEPPQSVRFDETKFRASAETWLESERVKWVKENTNVSKWTWAVVNGLIMPLEQLSGCTWSKLWGADVLEEAVERIKKGSAESAAKRGMSTRLIDRASEINREALSIGISETEQKAFNAAYASTVESEKPRPPKAEARKEPSSADEWFFDVIISVPRKGMKKAEYEKDPDTIGSLYHAAKTGDDEARKRLWGLAQKMDLKPREFNGKTYPPSEADKQTRKALDAFLAWEEAKGSEGAEQMRNELEDDEPPFI